MGDERISTLGVGTSVMHGARSLLPVSATLSRGILLLAMGATAPAIVTLAVGATLRLLFSSSPAWSVHFRYALLATPVSAVLFASVAVRMLLVRWRVLREVAAFIGPVAIEIAPGILRSQDSSRQVRLMCADASFSGGMHLHLEDLDPLDGVCHSARIVWAALYPGAQPAPAPELTLRCARIPVSGQGRGTLRAAVSDCGPFSIRPLSQASESHAEFLVAVQHASGWLLYRVDSATWGGDTWHESWEDMMAQVRFEYGEAPSSWHPLAAVTDLLPEIRKATGGP